MALLDGRLPNRPKAVGRELVRETVRKSSPVRLWNPTTARLRKNTFPLRIVLLALYASASLTAWAQTTVNDVHVLPREVEKPKIEEVAKQSLVPTMDTRVRPLKVAVDLVLVPVTITDPLNRLVTGLDKENFQLFECSSKEEIKSFSSEDAPVCLGVIFNSSAIMSSKMERAK